jgi:hypothetical protein
MSDAYIIAFGTILATIVGPISAVLITRWRDQKKEQYHRRLDIFRMLMRNRRNPVHPDFVGALNLIEIEFFGCSSVIQAWKNLLECYAGPSSRDQDTVNRHQQKTDKLRAELLASIARQLRFNIPELDIFHGGYSPVAHENLEIDQFEIRRLFADIARGTRELPITVRGFPPPPPENS